MPRGVGILQRREDVEDGREEKEDMDSSIFLLAAVLTIILCTLQICQFMNKDK